MATTVGPFSRDLPNDFPVYRGDALALSKGLIPYRDFGLEYPPLALVPIGLAGVLGLAREIYAGVFGGLMLVAAVLAQQAAERLGGRRAAWLLVLLPVAAGAIVRTRFDLVPTALALAGLAALAGARPRPRAAFALLALGTATKLFPALVAAVALAWLWGAGRRREARAGALAFAAVLAVCCVPFLLTSPSGFAAQLTFHLERPVQIESAPASVLWALGESHVTGTARRPDAFRSQGLAGGQAGIVAAAFALAQLAAVATAVALAARRRDPAHLCLAAFTVLLAFVALGKVLSPQFLLWLAPLAAVAGAQERRAWAPAALAALAVGLTQVEFPSRYFALVAGDRDVIALVAARNGLLLAALGLALRALAAGPARSPRRGAAAPDRSG